MLLAKRIIKISKQIVPYWWAPDAHGVIFHKLGMLGDISGDVFYVDVRSLISLILNIFFWD
jgi:hypothetical protein